MSRPSSALLLVCLASCSRPPAPLAGSTEPRSQSSATPRAHSTSAEHDASAALPALDADGCAADFIATSNATKSLGELARVCARGMTALEPTLPEATLGAGEGREFVFTIADASRCVRALGAFAPELRDLELQLFDVEGASLGRDSRQSSFALIGRGGPVCVKEAGRYRVTARAHAGQGAAAVQLYQVD
ncbi:MAG TPA: hypothetical protein VI072_04350 [Polyangiaceae bacterium]